MTTKQAIMNYEKAVQDITLLFIEKYFVSKDVPIEDTEYFWTGDRIGEILCVNDYFINFQTIKEAMEYDCPVQVLFDWYNFQMEKYEKNEPVGINIRNYILTNK